MMADIDATSKGGIGTLSEKLIHRTLKYYFEPDSSKHEIESYGVVADIKNDSGIIEIQTRSFEKLLPKLELFLANNQVTVVHPIIEKRMICRVNEETGEILPPRKSSKIGRPIDALPELAKISGFLSHENLKILLVFLDATETRMIRKKKKVGRHKTDKIDASPTSINSIIELKSYADYPALLPENLPQTFTSSEFGRICRLKSIGLHNSLKFLTKIGVLTRERKGGRAFIYTINKEK